MVVEHLDRHIHNRVQRALTLMVWAGEVDERLVVMKDLVTIFATSVIRFVVDDTLTRHTELLPVGVRERNVSEDLRIMIVEHLAFSFVL